MAPANGPLQPGQVVLQPGAVVPGQVVLQPVPVVQQPAGYPAAAPHPAVVPPPEAAEHPPMLEEEVPAEVRLYSHSRFLYWWPVWAVGYVMAIVTYAGGQHEQLGNFNVIIHPSKNLGVLYTLTFFLVILTTNISLRGLASFVAILSAAFIALLLAYFQLWEVVLSWFGHVAIYMNLGFYLFFSTIVLIVWVSSVFVYDRLTYWKVRPGQLTLEHVIGGAETNYDTRGMLFQKHRNDLFRHWILGFGSGDLEISTTGAKAETINIPNVLFINAKLRQIERLIAMKPTDSTVIV
jgi:hypothetical protein